MFFNNSFYQVVDITDPEIAVRKLKTKALNTDRWVRLPWQHVQVRQWTGEFEDTLVTLDKTRIESKAILSGNIISTVYTQWMVT